MKMKMKLLALVAAMVVAVSGFNTVQAQEKKVQLTFAVIQTEDMSVLANRWGDILKYLDDKADIQISFNATTSYSAVIEAMLSGFVQVAQLGSKA